VTPGAEAERLVALLEPKSGRTTVRPPETACVNAGPKYRARDRGGVIAATEIDPSDMIRLDQTLTGALVYVMDPGDGVVPATFRLQKIVGGRPTRAAHL
jgi:hypothetical protein